MNCAQINKLDLVNILDNMGFRPQQIKNFDYWYRSPFRKESKPSFKIDRRRNYFYDFGEGTGGTTVDFLTKYHKCTVSELIQRFTNNTFSFPKQKTEFKPESRCSSNKSAIKILSASEIKSDYLIKYLLGRGLTKSIYPYIQEVSYKTGTRIFKSIGFKNDLGGYELRSPYFKGCSSKHLTTIRDDLSNNLCVFEGFFDFLSFIQIQQGNKPRFQSDYLILNSLALLDPENSFYSQYDQINLYLDNDSAGIRATNKILNRYSNAKSYSSTYSNYKDLNEWLVKSILEK